MSIPANMAITSTVPVGEKERACLKVAWRLSQSLTSQIADWTCAPEAWSDERVSPGTGMFVAIVMYAPLREAKG